MSKRKPSRQGRPRAAEAPGGGPYWLYGRHSVSAALANTQRRLIRLVLRRGDPPPPELAGRADLVVEVEEAPALAALLPEGAVHQGVAALVAPLDPLGLDELLDPLDGRDKACVLLLDQVTDPRNVGAILRCAAAFGVDGVVRTDRNAPPETAALAKAASGALESVPLATAPNLARALASMKDAGFWCTGLAGEAHATLDEIDLTGRVGLVLGAEGDGLRRLTRDHCDHLARLPTDPAMPSLNVSTAAAVALYELVRQRQVGPGGTK